MDGSTSIVKVETARKADFDAFVAAMFLMWARAPRKAEPDVDGAYDLGEIGSTREKTWERLTPYNIAT